MEYYSERFEQTRKLTGEISDFLNNFHYRENADYFCEAMSREHRTLQQNFTRLVMAWLEYIASDEYRTDGRNEYSKTIAQRMILGYSDIWTTMHGESDDSFHPSRHLPTV